MMKNTRMSLNIQLFAATSSISGAQISQDTASNTSKVRLTFTVTRTSGTTYWANGKTLTFSITYQTDSGTASKSSEVSFSFPSSVTTKSATADFDIPHKSNGEQSVTFSAKIVTGTSAGTMNPSGSLGLSKINRYFTSTPAMTFSSKTETSIIYNWSTSETCSAISVSGSGSKSISGLPGTSGKITITGLSAETDYTHQGTFTRKDSGMSSSGPSRTNKTHPYPSISSKPSSFNIGDQVTIGINNPMNRSCAVYLILDDGTERGGDATTGGQIVGYNGDGWKGWFYQSVPNKPSGTYRVRLVVSSVSRDTTVAGGTYYVTNSNPTFDYVEYEDIDEKTLSLTGDNQTCVINYSDIKVTIPSSQKAVAINYATMSKYRLSIGTNTPVEASYSADEDVSLSVSDATSSTFDVYAIDSRGNSKPVQKVATNIISYEPLSKVANASSVFRTDEDGEVTGVDETVTLKYEGILWNKTFGQVDNSLKSVSYKYKKTTDADDKYVTGVTDITPTIDENGKFSFAGLIAGDTEQGFNIDASYNIVVIVKDELSTVEFSLVLGSGRPHIAYAPDGVSIMGKYDESVGGLFQVGGKRLEAGGDALPLGSIFKYDGNEVPSGYSQINDIIGEYATLFLDYEKAISCSAWTYTTFPFGGEGRFLTTNSNLFEQNGNYIRCKFKGRVLVVATLTHNSGSQMDLIVNNKRVIKVGGYFTQVIDTQDVTEGTNINLTFHGGATSFTAFMGTGIKLIIIKE